ncbi:MAG: hypothetical protein IT536_19515 [Hyphomicrobiales bacterium]|nr:hypothetical protein [Hyphomicrobiales bacterium]
MNPGHAPLTTFERTRLAYEARRRRQHDATIDRKQHERSRAIKVVGLSACALLLLTGLAYYGGWQPVSVRPADEAAPAGERAFSETRTGQVRSHYKGDTCRELLFSNEQGRFVGASLVDCSTGKPSDATTSAPARLHSIRDAFRGR